MESALHKARNHFEYNPTSDLTELAVQIFLGVAQNHGFEQGNKRTAWTAALMFLGINGYELNASIDGDNLGKFLRKIVVKKTPPEILVRILRIYARPLA